MVSNCDRGCPNSLVGGVQHLLYSRLPLTAEAFCRIPVPCIDSLIWSHSSSCTVPAGLEIPRTELVLNYCVHYSTVAHLIWNEVKIFRDVIFLNSIVSQKAINLFFWEIVYELRISTKIALQNCTQKQISLSFLVCMLFVQSNLFVQIWPFLQQCISRLYLLNSFAPHPVWKGAKCSGLRLFLKLDKTIFNVCQV